MAQNQPIFSRYSILLGAFLVGTALCDAPVRAQGTGGSSASPGGHPGVAGSATATYPGAPFRNTVGQPSTFQNSIGQTTRFGSTANRSAAAPSNPGNLNSGAPIPSATGGADTGQGTASGTTSGYDPDSYAAYAARARKVGTAPNGLPIGTTGSGPGSPEQPINSGSR